MSLRAWLEEVGAEELLLADGFDEAFIGIGRRCGQPDVAVYDYDAAVEALVAEGLEPEEAVEHLEFNVVGAWVGERTPMFVSRRMTEGE